MQFPPDYGQDLARLDLEAGDTGSHRRSDVGLPVANHESTGWIDRPNFHQIDYHAR